MVFKLKKKKKGNVRSKRGTERIYSGVERVFFCEVFWKIWKE